MFRFLVILFFISNSAVAQYEPLQKWNYKADVSLRYNFIQAAYRISLQPGFIFSHGKSNIRVAPILQLLSTEAVNDPYRMRFTGVSGIYRLQVPSARKFTELFFKYEGTFQVFSIDGIASIWDPTVSYWQPFEYHFREIYSSHTIGYGFNLNFKQLYIYTTVAGGIYFSRASGEPITEGAPEIPRYDFRGYDDFGLNYTISTGIGYRFPAKE